MSETPDSRTDEELIAAIDEGDSAAFDVLYHRYADWVLRMAWRLTGHEHDSLDVLQETFTYLARKFPGFELTAAMTTFLYPAVRNLSIAARRRRQKAAGAAVAVEDVAPVAPCGPPDIDELDAVLAALSDGHREILMLRFVDDLTQVEIAERLELPLGTVKSRLHHAIRAVRDSPTARSLLEG